MRKEVRKDDNPMFTRGEVARILNVTPLTVANRERRGQYPAPKRDLNHYRIYTLHDIFHLQVLTYSRVDPRPVISVLYDKGYQDMKHAQLLIDTVLNAKKGLA